MQYLSQRLAEKPARARGGGTPLDPLAARQRRQLLDAAEQLIAERGCARTSIEAIVKLARVSSVTFYEHFESKEECFVAALDRAVEEMGELLSEAASDELPWPDRIRVGLEALLGAVAADPVRARLCLVEAPKGVAALSARYEVALDKAAPILREGRALETAPRLPDTVEEATLGTIAWLLRDRLEQEESIDGIEAMLPLLTEVALSPYLGEDLAALATAGGNRDDG